MLFVLFEPPEKAQFGADFGAHFGALSGASFRMLFGPLPGRLPPLSEALASPKVRGGYCSIS